MFRLVLKKNLCLFNCFLCDWTSTFVTEFVFLCFLFQYKSKAFFCFLQYHFLRKSKKLLKNAMPTWNLVSQCLTSGYNAKNVSLITLTGHRPFKFWTILIIFTVIYGIFSPGWSQKWMVCDRLELFSTDTIVSLIKQHVFFYKKCVWFVDQQCFFIKYIWSKKHFTQDVC